MSSKFNLPPDWDARTKSRATKRCGNVTGCNLPIDFNEPHINLEERTFCCADCLQAYLDQETRFEYTAERLRGKDYAPLNYREKERWNS